MVKNRPQISVVVPAWHGHLTIGDCLRSIQAAARGHDVEIIVVESSGDAARDLIRQAFPGVTLLVPDGRAQVGVARNIGVSRASGKYVFFVDQDCTVPTDWFDRLVPLIQDPTVGAVGGSLGVRNPTNLSGFGVYFLEFFRHLPSSGRTRETTSFLLGSNLAVRREVFSEAHFPDQTLGEDVLFSAAIRRTGRRLLYAPAVSVGHWNRSGWKEFFRYNRLMGIAAANYHWELGTRSVQVLRRLPALVLLSPPANLLHILCRVIATRSWLLGPYLLLLPACLLGNLWWAMAFHRQLLARCRSATPDTTDTAAPHRLTS